MKESFLEKQTRLKNESLFLENTIVYIDPDGTSSAFLGLIVEEKTNVFYTHQCAGTRTETRFIEGYYVPIEGLLVSSDDVSVENSDFVKIFHPSNKAGCNIYDYGENFPNEKLKKIRELVKNIPFWFKNEQEEDKVTLIFDETRLLEICEGWIPVEANNKKGVLVFQNCD